MSDQQPTVKTLGAIKRMENILKGIDERMHKQNEYTQSLVQQISGVVDDKLIPRIPEPQNQAMIGGEEKEEPATDSELQRLEYNIIQMRKHEDFVSQNIQRVLRELLDRLKTL